MAALGGLLLLQEKGSDKREAPVNKVNGGSEYFLPLRTVCLVAVDAGGIGGAARALRGPSGGILWVAAPTSSSHRAEF